jgi:uncharacterized protein
MDDILKIFIIILVSWLTAELIKVVLDIIRKKRNKLKSISLFHYGGMPSSHSTFLTSFSISIFLIEGFTISFLISLALWILILRDIMVIRGHIDQNTENISVLSKGKLSNTILSHKLIEIIAGIFLGTFITIILYLLI